MVKYDVAVIGAGITGLSSAYHLKKSNPDLSIVVIDRARSYAQGNTGRATAGFRDLFSSDLNFALASTSIAFYRHAQESGNFDMGMKFTGYMFLLNEKEQQSDVLDSLKSRTRVMVLARDELSAIGSLMPSPSGEDAALMGLDPVVSAFIGLNCGIFEPDLVTTYYYNSLLRMEVEFLFRTEVTKLVLAPVNPLEFPGEPFLWQKKKISRIETSRGEVEADFFILATDVWTGSILDPVGIDNHVRPRKRQVFQIGGPEVEALLTDFSVNDTGIFPFTVLPAYGVHFRPAPREKQLRVSAPDYVGRDFSLDDYPEAERSYYDYSVKPVLQAYFPSLQSARNGGSWAGYYSYNTIDAHPYIFSNLNLIIATGTSGSGLMKGDAIGRVVSALYSGKRKARLFGGSEVAVSDLGIEERSVPPERFLL